jgi:hypothetical protein
LPRVVVKANEGTHDEAALAAKRRARDLDRDGYS